MQNSKMKKVMAGGISGFFNGLFGSGGGVVAVMFLRNIIGDEKKAHASATLMILIMSIASFVLYALYGHIDWQTGFKLVPGGIIGALIGTFALKNIRNTKLKKLFALVLVISGAVMLFS
ncbi:MAG: sulfite exporter TauE/SafE family protein [Ruminococcaceae bacterium]|nr:sulfite exporter TauE/SafE family protein [Oscillospiraceae bacterium]